MEQEISKTATTEETASKVKNETPTKKTPRTMLQLWGSRKLWMTVAAFTLNWIAYWQEIRYLHSFVMPEQIAAFSGITRDFHWVVAAGLMAYLGVTGAIEWKHGTTSIISQAASLVSQKTETKTENTQRNIIEEGKPGAPATRPFSQNIKQ